MPAGVRPCWLGLVWCILLSLPPTLFCLRCYVCGGNSGITCRDTNMDYKKEFPTLRDPVQDCNDLINNRGCVKQYVNGVVLLRGCWLDGSNKCLRNGAAEVCTCSADLCNSAPLLTAGGDSSWSLLITVAAAILGRLVL